jgi:ribosomal protein L11 methyltransferase
MELLMAELDGDAPLAVEDTGSSLRVFFSSAEAREISSGRLTQQPGLHVESIDVSDEDWAARSQAALTAVHVGRLVIAPPWDAAPGAIIIQPSMGFGTGHHATTRLCLRLMQDLPLQDARVLDVGTGSGVLAIAAATLGAAHVVALDNDPDALQSAAENVELNDVAARVHLTQSDVASGFSRTSGRTSGRPNPFDLVLANLTGATLVRYAPHLVQATHPRGHLIVSGYMVSERGDVEAALAREGLAAAASVGEDEWLASLWTRA